MRWTYDATHGALYVYFLDRAVADQIEMLDGSVVDVDSHGQVVGIEVLSIQRWEPSQAIEMFHLDNDQVLQLNLLREIQLHPSTTRPSAPREDARSERRSFVLGGASAQTERVPA